jgi:hypothetical protein
MYYMYPGISPELCKYMLKESFKSRISKRNLKKEVDIYFNNNIKNGKNIKSLYKKLKKLELYSIHNHKIYKVCDRHHRERAQFLLCSANGNSAHIDIKNILIEFYLITEGGEFMLLIDAIKKGVQYYIENKGRKVRKNSLPKQENKPVMVSLPAVSTEKEGATCPLESQ